MSAMNVRDMPVTIVRGPLPDHSYVVELPGSLRVPARTWDAVELLVKRNAPGSAIRLVKDAP